MLPPGGCRAVKPRSWSRSTTCTRRTRHHCCCCSTSPANSGIARIVLVVGYRSTELTHEHPLTVALADLTRSPGARRINLEGLTPGEISEYLERVTGGDVDPAVVDAIEARTDGNPLFVSELVRLILADQSTTRAPVRLPDEIPEGVQEAIARRVAALVGTLPCDARCRGDPRPRRSSRRGARAGSETDAETLLDTLDEAVAAGMLVRDAGRDERLPLLARPCPRRAPRHAPDRPALADPPARRGSDPEAACARSGVAPHGGGAPLHRGGTGRRRRDRGAICRRSRGGLPPGASHTRRRSVSSRLRSSSPSAGPRSTIPASTCCSSSATRRRAPATSRARKPPSAPLQISPRVRGRPDALRTAALGYGGRFAWCPRGSRRRAYRPPRRRAQRHRHERLRSAGAAAIATCRRTAQRARSEAAPFGGGGSARDGAPARGSACARPRARWLPRCYLEHGHSGGATRTRRGDDRKCCPARTTPRKRSSPTVRDGSPDWELGDFAAAHADIAACVPIAARLQQPAQRWLVAIGQACVALFEGSFEEVERFALAGRSEGQGSLQFDADGAYLTHLAMLRLEQGRRGEFVADLAAALKPIRGIRSCARCWRACTRRMDSSIGQGPSSSGSPLPTS